MGGWKANWINYQKQPRPAVNFYTLDARKGAENNANVSRQHSSALHFATVVDLVLGTKNYTSLMVTYLIHRIILLIAGFKGYSETCM